MPSTFERKLKYEEEFFLKIHNKNSEFNNKKQGLTPKLLQKLNKNQEVDIEEK